MSAARGIATGGAVLFLTGMLGQISLVLGTVFLVVMVGMMLCGYLLNRQMRREDRLRGRRR